MDRLSAEGLLAGLASGDPDEAAAFVRRFQRRVYGLAWTIVRDDDLPGSAERLEQASAIEEALLAAGYKKIGLDHFALPEDELAIAAAKGALHRNFQGYTTDGCSTLIGFGASAIGRLPSSLTT